jgi:hypothetical protein
MIKVFDRPVTYAYELLAKLRVLTLTGQDEDGELEWVGPHDAWQQIEEEENAILWENQFQKLWK